MRKYGTKLITVAILALPILASPASAQEQRRVYYADLDLSTQRGARVMLQRLDNAARDVCGGDWRGSNSRIARAAEAEQIDVCRDQAMRTALAELNAPEVARAYEETGALAATSGR